MHRAVFIHEQLVVHDGSLLPYKEGGAAYSEHLIVSKPVPKALHAVCRIARPHQAVQPLVLPPAEQQRQNMRSHKPCMHTQHSPLSQRPLTIESMVALA